MKAKPIPTIISLDWDWFLPYCVTRRHDWNHSEGNPFFYEAAWHCRTLKVPERMLPPGVVQPDLEKDITVDPARVRKFWASVYKPAPRLRVSIQDSHGRMLEFARQWDKVNVVNFDAHHDTGYQQVVEPDCSNWVYFLRKEKRLHHYTLVYPAWRKEQPESGTLRYVDNLIYCDRWLHEPIAAAGAFLCRSSCWMPPWLDQHFETLRQVLLFHATSGIQCEYVVTPRKWPVQTQVANAL